VRTPRLEVKRPENVVDFHLLKSRQSDRMAIAGTLLVASRRTGHLVVVAECPDEAFSRSIW